MRFGVYEGWGQPGYLLDCQNDLLDGLNTRFVVPLLPFEEAPVVGAGLNPIFVIGDQRFSMVTQYASTVTVIELGRFVISMANEEYVITDALDMLTTG
jgi:toxin CcdB